MAFKILTENSVDNTNIDGARAEHFNAGLRDGIVKGAFNEGTFTALASNVISFDTCELRISGHRVIIDEIWTQTFSSSPSVATRYALVGQIVVDSSSSVEFSLFVQNAATQLVKDNLFRTENGAGTYQVEIGRFTLTTNGTIADITRTIKTITGGSSGKNDHFVSGEMTTIMLDAGMDANVIPEDIYDANGDYVQTNMTWELPETAGTVVTVNNVEQANLSFTSDPQTQLNNKVDKETGKGLSTNDYTNEEKTKLGGIEAEANKTIVDSSLSSSSENPVQNKVVNDALVSKADASNVYTKTETDNLLNNALNDYDTLFSNNITAGQDITLSQSIANYKFLAFYCCDQDNGGKTPFTMSRQMFQNSHIDNWNRVVVSGYSGFVSFYYINNTTIHISTFSNGFNYFIVRGIK